MRAIGYLRVSTDEQAGSGLGLEAQRSAITAAASRLGCELGPVYADEGVSGALPPHERPELRRALLELRRGEVLLVAKRDRLGRDRLEVGLLERELGELGIRVVSAAGEGSDVAGSGGLLQRGLADLLAEHERAVIRERTRDALKAKRARGERVGTVPYGMKDVGGKLVEHYDESRALGLMKELRAQGMGYVRIARHLEERGFRPRGKKWWPEGVRKILMNAARRSTGT